MTYQEVMAQAKGSMGKCKACPVCNGQACRNTIPGPGAKGVGDTAIRNYDAWQRLRVNMDTLCPYGEADTAFTLFGRTFAAPIFAGPVGAVTMHYSDKYNDETYNAALVSGCAQAGIAAFTGDGLDANVMVQATKAIRDVGGVGVPTVKPWNMELIREKLALVRESGAFAVAMDVDAAGLPFLKGMNPPAGSKTVEQLRQIREAAGLPFIVKGVMTVKGALKSLEAGADAILVSNHGGRVLDGCAATAEVLPEIVAAVEGRVPVLVDGGIRTGTDVFRALALLRWLHTPAGADKNRIPQLLLQCADDAAEVGLSDKEIGRRGRDGARTVNGQGVLQLLNGHDRSSGDEAPPCSERAFSGPFPQMRLFSASHFTKTSSGNQVAL